MIQLNINITDEIFIFMKVNNDIKHTKFDPRLIKWSDNFSLITTDVHSPFIQFIITFTTWQECYHSEFRLGTKSIKYKTQNKKSNTINVFI